MRDSAGVTIVESRAPAWRPGAGWRLADAPLLEIGAVDGPPEYQFERVEGALRLPDGRIVVADELEVEHVRLYSLEKSLQAGSGDG